MSAQNDIFTYLKLLFRDTVTLFNAIFIAFNILFLFFKFPLFKLEIPLSLSIIISIILLLIASFRVWRKERSNIFILTEKIKNLEENPVKYSFDSKVKKRVLSFEDKELNKELILAENNINQLDSSLFWPAVFGTSQQNWIDYKKNLLRFKKEISDLTEGYNNHYHLEFFIKNEGLEYDQNLILDIKSDNNLRFINPIVEEMQFPEFPERPKSFPSLAGSLISPSRNREPYREILKFNEKNITVKLKDLHVENEVEVFPKGFIINSDREKVTLQIELRSIKTKKAIKKSLDINLKGCEEEVIMVGKREED